MGGQLARSRSSVLAEVDAFVRFEVSLLSGDTLFMLHDRIVGCLDIADADVLLQFLVSKETDHCGHLVEETTAAAELSGCQVTVVVNREPDWCTNKCFKKFCESRGLHSRRSNQAELKVFEGGRFIYQRHFQRIGPAWWVDENTTARGRAASSDAARCFWAAATLRWRQEEFLTGAKEMARPLLPQCSEQDLSNIAWASASLGFNPSGWISEVVGSYARQYSEEPCSPQAVANLLWSLAKAFEGGFGDQAILLATANCFGESC
eukprot:s1206_g11.t1